MIDLLLPPGVILVVAGIAMSFVTEGARKVLMLVAPLLVLLAVWGLPEGNHIRLDYLGLTLEPLKVDALSRLFATVFSIMAFAGGLFSLNQRNANELAAAFVYAGSAIGVTFAGDLLTVFIFWEIMAIASSIVIWSGGPGARAAGLRYAAIHFLGGVLLMAGVAGLVATTGSTEFTAMRADSISTWLIVLAFLVNAAAWPLSAWLPDAYPKSSWTGMVFLSAFTTKTAIYTLMRGFPGEDWLIWVGVVMVFYGVLYAILEKDMRRMMAYSIVSQVGFMVVAVGIGTETAINGAAAHGFAHILYKALLLMSAGSVVYMTGRSRFSDLGGLFRSMPVTCICGVIGALSIASLPLTSGFVAKSMISEAAGHEKMVVLYYLLAVASAGTAFYAGVKFPWYTFFSKDCGLRPEDPPWNMRAAMILCAVLCIGIGIWYAPLYDMLPYPVDYEPYTASHVVFYLQLILFSALAFFVLKDAISRARTITLDVDWLWRRGGRAFAREFQFQWLRAHGRLVEGVLHRTGTMLTQLYETYGPDGPLSRTRPSGAMALWVTGLLTVFLIFSYL